MKLYIPTSKISEQSQLFKQVNIVEYISKNVNVFKSMDTYEHDDTNEIGTCSVNVYQDGWSQISCSSSLTLRKYRLAFSKYSL